MSVADTGTGMDEETREKLFEPFFSTKGREEGTGLGLAMVYGIVTQSGGTIRVESAPGEGATFLLYFPVAEGEAETLDEGAEAVADTPDLTGRILVVEDEEGVRRVVRATLERAGFEVVTMSDAESGLEALEEDGERSDLLLTDLVLPGTSGRSVIDRVRGKDAPLPIVAMSGFAEGSPGRRDGLPSGVFFIQKPFAPEDLVRVVREALAKGGAGSR